MITSILPVRVRYAETDRMNVVHHSNYLIWFESVRIQMLDELGLPYKDLEERGFMIPVLGASLRYLKPAFFDDRLKVYLFMREKARAKFHFDYEVRRDGELLATGSTTHGFMDAQGKGLRPPTEFVEKLEEAWKV
ncbi:acyl-CoA thioesterase [Coraliomargarita parva]|uniref:acyl-CoA thioesterase n=1 Tax=Coraliomargarita parva TaxID=3014050 RepID=UPI0022B5C491|nr:thioesterase family protein [Coraliomargarita parva]